MCLGALLECLHFHAGLDSWKMNKSIPERGEKRLSVTYGVWVARIKREQEYACSSPCCPRSSGSREEGRGEKFPCCPTPEMPPLPLTQGQGRPWRGLSSHAASLGPHSQLMAAACSPCLALSPRGSGGEGAAGPHTLTPSSCWPRGRPGPVLTWFWLSVLKARISKTLKELSTWGEGGREGGR